MVLSVHYYTMFHKNRQCESKIKMHSLHRLILIHTVVSPNATTVMLSWAWGVGGVRLFVADMGHYVGEL